MTVPVVMAPVMVTPTPVAAVPAPVPLMPVVMMPVVTPADLFRLETIDLVLRNHGGLRAVAVRRHQALLRRNRRQRRGLHACGKRGRACDKSKGEFQKVTAFHEISLVC
jgi:hypothetical protein